MSEKEKLKVARKITASLMENKNFNLYMDDPAVIDGYMDIIPEPQYLKLIYRRFEEHRYHTFDSWKNDMLTMFRNCSKFNKDIPVIINLNNEAKRIFLKEIKAVDYLTMEGLSKTVLNQMEKLSKLFSQAPSSIKSIIPKENNYTHAQSQPITEDDTNKVLEIAQSIKEPEEILKLNQIMEYFNVKPVSSNKGDYNYKADEIGDECKRFILATFSNPK